MKSTSRVLIYVFFSTVVGLMLAVPAHAQLDLDAAVAVWLFDEGGGDVAEDTSGHGNDGELVNDPKWVDGRYGSAVELDGSRSHVEVFAPVDLPVDAEPRTISLSFKWTKIRWPCPAMQLLGYGNNAPGQRFGLSIECNPHGLGIETCLYARTFKWNGDDDDWHHLAVVFPEGGKNASDTEIYFDGDLEDADDRAADQKLQTAGAPLTIGCVPQAKVYFFNGIIDDVAIFPVPLGDKEIQAIARFGLEGARTVSPTGRLAASWGRLKSQ